MILFPVGIGLSLELREVKILNQLNKTRRAVSGLRLEWQ